MGGPEKVSYRVDVDDLVLDDLQSGCTWYEDQHEGLGERFAAAFFSCLDEIAEHPFACPRYLGAGADLRHTLIEDFPYAVYFRVVGQCVIVSIVFHGSRDPATLRRGLRRRSP